MKQYGQYDTDTTFLARSMVRGVVMVITVAVMIGAWVLLADAEPGFDKRYQYDKNPYAILGEYEVDNPRSELRRLDPDSAWNELNRLDPDNPRADINRFQRNNPENHYNRFHPENPKNPMNFYRRDLPYKPLD